VSVIANVLERDVEVLEMLTGKLSINTVKDTVNESNIISLNGISELIIGGKKYVQLKLGNSIYPIKHLIICAPTIGLCDQLAVNLQKGLNALKMCLNAGELENKMPYIRYSSSSEHNEREGVENGSTDLTREDSNDFSDWEVKSDLEIDKKSGTDCSYNNYGNMQHHSGPQIPSVTEQFNIVEGGGAFEILFHKLLQDFTTSCTDPNLSLMCEILEKTMISLVKTLYDNTSIQSESSRGFLVVKTILQEKRNGDLWGLNRRGIPGCMSEQGVIEPLMSKIHVLHCVLNLVEQLLGIDQIVSVRKLECTKDDTE
jgi:chaperonin GroEL (HSP60 family)